MQSTPIKTRHVSDRRTLRFGRISDIVEDVRELDGVVETGGRIVASGNWTAPQIVHHVGKIVELSLDGFPAKAPLPIRLLGAMMRSRTLVKPMAAGFKIPSVLRDAVPPEDVTWAEARDGLYALAARLDSGERMTHPSPAFGELAHEEWIQMHCRHAEMHFGFMRAETGTPA